MKATFDCGPILTGGCCAAAEFALPGLPKDAKLPSF